MGMKNPNSNLPKQDTTGKLGGNKLTITCLLYQLEECELEKNSGGYRYYESSPESESMIYTKLDNERNPYSGELFPTTYATTTRKTGWDYSISYPF